jgi:hypothetical protein
MRKKKDVYDGIEEYYEPLKIKQKNKRKSIKKKKK